MAEPEVGYLVVLLAVAAAALVLLVLAVVVIHRRIGSMVVHPTRTSRRRTAQTCILMGIFGLGYAAAVAVYGDFDPKLTLMAIGVIAMGGILMRQDGRDHPREPSLR